MFNLDPGQRGSWLHAATADFALSTNREFIGDPEGLTDIALRRRTDAMLSSALKHGTTKIIKPQPDQIKCNAKLGVPPLEWKNDEQFFYENLQNMIRVSIDSTLGDFKEVEMSVTTSHPAPSDLARQSLTLMKRLMHGMPVDIVNKVASDAQLLKERFSSDPWHGPRAAKDPDYWVDYCLGAPNA